MIMTYWLIFPANKLNAIESVYGNAGVKDGEIIGTPVYNTAGDKCFTGSSRLTAGQSDQLILGNAPWLEITDDPSFMQDAEWQTP